MTEKYTPEKVAELITEAREKGRNNISKGITLNDRLADALTAVTAERDWHRSHYERLLREKVELVAERDAAIRDLYAGFAESDHLSAKYYQRMRRAEDDLTMAQRMGRAENSDSLRLAEINTELRADCDRLHKAITKALAERMSMGADRILRAALDKEGDAK